MRTVWAVTRGSYSDYKVLAIFAANADAERHLATASASGIWNRAESVEQFDFYDEGEQPELITWYERSAVILDDGSATHENESVQTDWDYDQLYGHQTARPSVRFVRAPIYQDKGGRLEIRGTDRQAVNQSYGDNLAQIRYGAEQTGTADLPYRST